MNYEKIQNLLLCKYTPLGYVVLLLFAFGVSGGSLNMPTDSVDDSAALTVSVGTLSLGFDVGTSDYNLLFFYENSSIGMTPTTSNPSATVSVRGVVLVSSLSHFKNEIG